jgi:hypothetical protein
VDAVRIIDVYVPEGLDNIGFIILDGTVAKKYGVILLQLDLPGQYVFLCQAVCLDQSQPVRPDDPHDTARINGY